MRRLLIDAERVADLEGVRELRQLLGRVLESAGVSQSLRSRMALCISEAATNVVEHGCPRAQHLIMQFGQDADGWRLHLDDDGGAWEGREVDLLDLDADADHGRGVALIQAQCDQFDYVPGDDERWNRLRLGWRRPPDESRVRVMVVEDDPAQRRLYELYLTGEYDVVAVAGGIEALAVWADAPPDLVVSDVNMPGLDGIGLREQLLSQSETELTAFIFLTGIDDSSLSQRAISLGVDDFLVKPVCRKQLLQAIERVLNRGRQIRARLEQRIEARITASLLPQLPAQIPGWRFALAVRNTGRGGGDLLMHRSIGDDFCLLLSDIMGHDDVAKFFAHAYAGYLRGIMRGVQAGDQPGATLAHLSTAAFDDSLLSQILITCTAVTLGTNGRVLLATAGHPPPWLVTAAGLRSVNVSGMLPGLLPEEDYETVGVRLSAGERLVLFTDGIYESADSSEGRRQLEAAVKGALVDTMDKPIDRALRQVMRCFDEHAQDPPADDALLLLIESA